MGNRVLVAGGAGFLGSWCVEHLVQAGAEVIAFDNYLSGNVENLYHVKDEISVQQGDIRRIDDLRAVPGPIDAIVHLAFPTPLCTREHDLQFHDIAAQGTANLLQFALEQSAYFLYGSSISVYGFQNSTPITEEHECQPALVYGANKLHGENLCRAFGQIHGLKYGILRYSDLYGPRDRRRNAINNFLAAAMDNSRIEIRGGGAQRRSYTFVADAAAATVMALNKKIDGDVVNLASDHSVSISELAKIVTDQFAPTLPISNLEGPTDPRHYIFSNEKFARLVGCPSWTPLGEGLEQTFQQLKSSGCVDNGA
jgi:UDP-glucose 4-epimerase